MPYILLYSNSSMQGSGQHEEFLKYEIPSYGCRHPDGFAYDYLLRA